MSADTYLATGFRNVDGAGADDVYVDCLALLDALPFYRHVKQDSYARMHLEEGSSVLDAGCGLGFDAFRMASQVGRRGHVVGFDASTALIERAREDPRTKSGSISFCVGDLTALPFDDDAFDRCRIDRVLQHTADAKAVLAELVRALRPGGILLAYDNDWRTFTVTSDESVLTRRIEDHWCASFANARIGRNLPHLFQEAGLGDIACQPHVSVIEDFETADAVYNLCRTAERLAALGDIAEDEAKGFIAGLQERAAGGTFAVELTAYTVTGQTATDRKVG